jgi:hypothetical protein
MSQRRDLAKGRKCFIGLCERDRYSRGFISDGHHVCVCVGVRVGVCVAWGGLWSVSKGCVNGTVSVLWSGLICVSVGVSVIVSASECECGYGQV